MNKRLDSTLSGWAIKVSFLLCVAVFSALPAAKAIAANPSGTCTWDAPFVPTPPVGGTGIASHIKANMYCMLYGTTINRNILECPPTRPNVAAILYSTISADTGFIFVIKAALTLYVVIYGICFMLGIVQLTLVDFIQRMIKFGVVAALISPESWSLIYNNLGTFFVFGTDWLALQAGALVGAGDPFQTIDIVIYQVLSARLFVTLVAIFFSGPYGLIFGLLLLMSIGTIVAAVLQALWIYIMAMVVRAFLLGLAPLFISFLLFSKTKHLFDGWLNQLVNTMLQPAFLMIFFAFFVTLVMQSLGGISNSSFGGIMNPNTHICYMPSQGLFRGTAFDMVMPRFIRNGQPYGGPIQWTDDFPINIFDILIFLILTQITWRFNGIVLKIAQEISAGSTNLMMDGALGNILNPAKAFTDKANAAARAAGGNMSNIRRAAAANTGARPPAGGGGAR